MANEYYARTAAFAERTRAKGSDVSSELDAIITGLDKLPTEAALKTGTSNYAADTGTANAYIVTLAYTPTLADGVEVQFKALNSSTGASALNVSGTGDVPIIHSDGTALIADSITAGAMIQVRYDGTSFVLMSQSTGFVVQQINSNGAIANGAVVDDTTPQLGGELDAQQNKVINLGDATSADDALTLAQAQATALSF